MVSPRWARKSKVETGKLMSTDKQPLIRARIRTRLGNVVTRLVKPDNPNIVERLDTGDQQAQRRARTVKPKQAQAEPPKASWEAFDWRAIGHIGCCGGRILVATPKVTAGIGEAALRKEWETSIYGKRYYDQYMKSVNDFKAGLEHLVSTGRNLDRWYGYGKRDLEAQIRTYQAYVDRYSWETCLKTGQVYGSMGNPVVDPKVPLMGVTMSSQEFPGSTPTPAGLFVRSDCRPGSGCKLREADMPKAVTNVDLSFMKDPAPYRGYTNSVTVYPTAGVAHTVLAGQSAASNTRGQFNWLRIRDQVQAGKAKPGHVFTLIANHNQQSEAAAEAYANHGFECVLITGNNNHPGTSVLYFYEHKLTQAEFDYIKALPR